MPGSASQRRTPFRHTPFIDNVVFRGNTMTRNFRTYLAFAMMLCGLFAIQSARAASQADLKGTNVVLVHGAFADGSSWDRVIPLLEARGLHVVAVQNPLS